jgi:hypothetical protein
MAVDDKDALIARLDKENKEMRAVLRSISQNARSTYAARAARNCLKEIATRGL